MKPALFQWTGEEMRPVRPTQKLCDLQFVVGQVYSMQALERRSAASHRHYFAAIHEAWLNLPEDQAERFPTDEHLRKHALIKVGFSDQRTIVCSSRAEALRVAEFIKPLDGYAIVTVQGAVVYHFTAQSQSMAAMGKETFQRSKDLVLDYIASLIGVTGGELARQGEAA